jgi:hypothetical protein
MGALSDGGLSDLEDLLEPFKEREENLGRDPITFSFGVCGCLSHFDLDGSLPPFKFILRT